MARSFDGVDDDISFGSDASIDDFTQKSILLWTSPLDAGKAAETFDVVIKSNGVLIGPTGWQLRRVIGPGNTGRAEFTQDFSVVDGTWVTAVDTWPPSTPTHVAVTYDNSATSNDPNIYLNGTLQAETESSMPNGSAGADAAQNLVLGLVGNTPYDGEMQNFLYDNTILTAAQINRHRWHGRIGGPVKVMHQMYTDKLTNEGSATANGTATGTTVASLPRTQREWSY